MAALIAFLIGALFGAAVLALFGIRAALKDKRNAGTTIQHAAVGVSMNPSAQPQTLAEAMSIFNQPSGVA